MNKLRQIGGFDTYNSERKEWQEDVDLLASITHIHVGMHFLVNPPDELYEFRLLYKLGIWLGARSFGEEV